jgi:hypothetical protein
VGISFGNAKKTSQSTTTAFASTEDSDGAPHPLMRYVDNSNRNEEDEAAFLPNIWEPCVQAGLMFNRKSWKKSVGDVDGSISYYNRAPDGMGTPEGTENHRRG